MSEQLFQIGDIVFVNSPLNPLNKTTVENITPKGAIRVKGFKSLFNSWGNMKGDNYYSNVSIKKYTEELDIQWHKEQISIFVRGEKFRNLKAKPNLKTILNILRTSE